MMESNIQLAQRCSVLLNFVYIKLMLSTVWMFSYFGTFLEVSSFSRNSSGKGEGVSLLLAFNSKINKKIMN